MASIGQQSVIRHAFAFTPCRQLTSRSAATLTKPAFVSRPLAQLPTRSSVLRNAMPVAAFHASGRKAILPPPPQSIKGGINDPAPVPGAHPFHGSYHWTFERLISAGLIPLTLAPFIGGSLNPVMDSVLGAAIIVHSHIGFQACIVDYFPHWRVPKTKATLVWLLRVATVLTGIGYYEFETNDVGITQAVARIWKA